MSVESSESRSVRAFPGPYRVPGPSALARMAAARELLAEADAARVPRVRYTAAHLAALRAAAAVLAARGTATDGRGRPRSAWTLLADAAPELAEWARYFAAGAARRAAAEAGLPSAVTVRQADDLRRDAETFLSLVETVLGLDHQAVLPMARAS